MRELVFPLVLDYRGLGHAGEGASEQVGGSGERLEVVDAMLLDAYVAKVTALSTAVEAAGAVIRLGDVVVEH